jgi:hypothetical protein
MAEGRGSSSDRNRAATVARVFARPIGGVREANCRDIWKLVEPGGIEPPTS